MATRLVICEDIAGRSIHDIERELGTKEYAVTTQSDPDPAVVASFIRDYQADQILLDLLGGGQQLGDPGELWGIKILARIREFDPKGWIGVVVRSRFSSEAYEMLEYLSPVDAIINPLNSKPADVAEKCVEAMNSVRTRRASIPAADRPWPTV